MDFLDLDRTCPLNFDVLIAGAGPAGSASAIHLARQGFRVLAVDRAAFPRDKACSEYLGPEAVRQLDGLGVLADLEAAGASLLTGTTVIAAGGARLAGTFAAAGHAPFRATGLAVSRRLLDARLVQAAREAGATVLERTSIEQLLFDRGAVAGAVLRDADGHTRVARARLTVGADGLRSIVARRIGRRRHGAPSRIAFVAHLAGVEGMTTQAEMHVSEQGYVGLNHLGGGVTNVALVVPQRSVAAARGRATGFFLDSLRRFPGVRDRIAGRAIIRAVLVTGPFAAWSGRVVTDGAVLVGDAADFFDPFTGEGIYSALKGAELLASAVPAALADGGPVTAARLSAYLRARRRAFAGKWAVERMIGYGMLMPALFDRAVERLGRRGLADTLIGVTADFVPASAVLNPRFLARMVL